MSKSFLKLQSENGEDIKLSSYSVFRTSLINLIIWRFLIAFCWVFLLTFVPLMIFAEAMDMTVLQNWISGNGFLVTLGVLLITIYVNFFLFNYTFLVGNGRVLVYRYRFKVQKKIGEFFASDYKFEFETIRGRRGGSIGFFFIKSKERKRGRSFPTGLSRPDAETMHYMVEKLSDVNTSKRQHK